MWSFTPKLRRVRRYAPAVKEDTWVPLDLTYDDVEEREPWWEEAHVILGEDTLKGYECLVVESKNRVDPNYYLSKRVSWIEKEKFLEVHEEQFNKEGKLYKVIDKDWEQIKPWNYWVLWQWNQISLGSGVRSLNQFFDWIFDKGVSDKMFTDKAMRSLNIWRKPSAKLPPYIKKLSDFPPEPQIRWEFWNKIGGKPQVIEG